MSCRVVVGIGPDSDERVVRWAAQEARNRGLGVRLVHALALPAGVHPQWVREMSPALHRGARRVLDEAATVVGATAPGVEIETAVIEGGPVAVLRAEAAGAATAVVGHEGLGRLGDLLLGGVVRGLRTHLQAPLVVVPPDYEPSTPRPAPAPVVVGDDATPGSAGAWRYAADRAQRRGARLVAVRVAGELPVDRQLADRTRDAEVLVIGIDGSWFHRSTGLGVVRLAACPVVIVPPRYEDRAADADPGASRPGGDAASRAVPTRSR